MRSIYNLTTEYANLLEMIETADGETTPEIDAALDDLTGEIPAKLESLCQVIETLHAQEVGVQAVLDRLERQKTTAIRGQARLKDWIKRTLELTGERKLRCGTFNVQLWKNSQPSVEFAGGEIPERYRRVKIELDKAGVVRDFKDGVPLPDGFTVSIGFHVRIS